MTKLCLSFAINDFLCGQKFEYFSLGGLTTVAVSTPNSPARTKHPFCDAPNWADGVFLPHRVLERWPLAMVHIITLATSLTQQEDKQAVTGATVDER